jgi:hypothetical protein
MTVGAKALDAVQTHPARLSGRVGCNGRHERRLAASAVATLVATMPPAPAGIVDLHHAGELPGAVALRHRLIAPAFRTNP